MLSVAQLPGAESYCKGYQNKDGEKMQQDTNPTEVSAQDWQLKVDLRTS